MLIVPAVGAADEPPALRVSAPIRDDSSPAMLSSAVPDSSVSGVVPEAIEGTRSIEYGPAKSGVVTSVETTTGCKETESAPPSIAPWELAPPAADSVPNNEIASPDR